MVESISVWQWVNLLAALFFFVGPGVALLSFYPERQGLDKTQAVILAFGLSTAAWPVLLAWLKLAYISLTPAVFALILALGWAVGLWRFRSVFHWTNLRKILMPGLYRTLLWSAAGLSVLVGLWGIRRLVVGLGSDSYHHTLIAQLIASRGGLPDGYLPLAPLASFSYHYGFHALVAAMDWLTVGIPIRLLAPVMFVFLVPASALAAAFLTESATRSRAAGLVSAVVTGLVCVFPAFMGNWGRYTQLTGTLLLALFLGLFWRWLQAGLKWSHLPFIAILATGLALAHYRVTLMAVPAVLVLMAIHWVTNRPGWRVVAQHLLRGLGAALLALLLGAPWLWLVAASHRLGYAVSISPGNDASYSISRLGITVLEYPTNYGLLPLAGLALVWGWLKRDVLVIWLTLWVALMLLLSGPGLLAGNMDTVSVVISAYLPLAVLLGWLVEPFHTLVGVQQPHQSVSTPDVHPPRWARLGRGLAALGLLALSLWGVKVSLDHYYPSNVMVRPADLPALDWVRAHTPPDTLFMVNTFHWPFNDEYIIGSDAGYWLPLLAGRQTVTLPMTYTLERTVQPGLAERLIALDRLNGQLTSPEALAVLRQAGVTYVFTGERGGMIDVNALLASPAYELLYQQGAVAVFRLKPAG
jgi:hypothetical protein